MDDGVRVLAIGRSFCAAGCGLPSWSQRERDPVRGELHPCADRDCNGGDREAGLGRERRRGQARLPRADAAHERMQRTRLAGTPVTRSTGSARTRP